MLATVIAAALVFVNASDGDTMVVRDGNVKTVLRLAEIDAPERTQPYRRSAGAISLRYAKTSRSSSSR